MSCKISILVEGSTEIAFKEILRKYLAQKLPAGKMPRLDFLPQDGRLPKKEKLQRLVKALFSGRAPSTAVIALTDVYTGTADFTSAADAKQQMKQWVGATETRFHPHVALHDFEAWLIPYWSEIQRLAGSNRQRPAGNPESINHDKPPAYHLIEVFRTGSKGKKYVKPRDATRILRDQDLAVSAQQCPELQALLDTIVQIAEQSN